MNKKYTQLPYTNYYKGIGNTFYVVLIFCFVIMTPLDAISKNKIIEPLVTSKYSCSVTNSTTVIQPLQSGNWNNRAIWPNNTRPSLNDDVLIPEGMTITPFGNCFAKSLTINGVLQAVKTQENGAWFNLTTEYIMVMGANARFEIGTATQHYKSTQGVNITLIGTDATKLIPGTTVNSKAIMVMDGGQLEMHGKPKTSWTQLGATVAAGSNIITLKEPINWEVGDEIVIASTDFDMNHAETRQITAVNSATSYTLNEPLEYQHFGELQNYTHGKDSSITWEVDERAEVGLLSHNITIKGDDTSEANGYGGHLMCMPNSKMNADNIELYHMGQKGTLGRYPWHWHLLQEGGTGLYLKNSSIHRTFNRAVTIHGTNNTLVEGNVAYDNLGHAYFFEDGNEINNVMQYNLGLVTRRPSEADALLPSDVDLSRNMSGPATFWITHPHNKINFNHAAGSDGSGIWFAPHQNRSSAIYDPSLNPNHIPVPKGNWDNNVAHSSTHGLLVGPTVFANDRSQTVNPNLDYYPKGAPSNELIEVKNYTLFKNNLAAYMRIGQNTRSSKWENFIIADNYKGEALTWDGDMYQFLWVGASNNYEPIPENAIAIGGAGGLVHLHTIYDGPSRVHDSHFTGVLPEMSLFDQWGANIKYVGHTLTNTTVANGSFNINWRDFNNRPVWENATVVDTDGIFTGLDPLTVMHKDIPVLSNENTTVLSGSNGAISSSLNKYCYVEIKPSDEILFQQKRQRSVFTRSDGAIQEDNLIEIQGVSLVPMVNDQYTYQIAYEKSIPAVNSMQYFSMDGGDNVIIGYPDMPITAKAYNRNLDTDEIVALAQLTSLEELINNNQTSYAFDKGVLYVKYVAPIGSKFDNIGKIGQVEVCLYGNCESGENEPYKDTDGDNMFDYVEILNCRNPESARDLSFDFNSSSEKFSSKHIDVKHNAEDNWLLRADFRTDPYINRGGFAIAGSDLKLIRVRVQCDIAGEFVLFWATENGTYHSSRQLKLDYSTPGAWKELEFNLEGNEQWEGKIITGLRLDFPVDETKRVHTRVDYIKGDQDPQPPNLTPYSAVLGHPLKKTNTVNACEGDSVLFDFFGEFSEEWNFIYYSPDGKIYNGGTNGVNNDQLKLLNLNENSDLLGTWTVSYTNPSGCSNNTEFIINVTPQPELRQFVKSNNASFREGNSIAVCDGDSVVFDFLGSFSNDWKFEYINPAGETILGGSNGEDIDQLQVADITDNGSLEGVWQVSYTNPNGCSNNAEFTVSVTPQPELRQFIKVNEEPFQETNVISIEPGDTVTFDMLGAFDQDWTFTYTRPDGREFAGGTNNADSDQIYLNNISEGSVNEGEWIVNYTNPQGCSGSGTFTLTIDTTLSISQENPITQNTLNLYPNPAINLLTVTSNQLKKDSVVRLYNVQGRYIKTYTLSTLGQLIINVDNLVNGMYFLIVKNDFEVITRKFLVAR